MARLSAVQPEPLVPWITSIGGMQQGSRAFVSGDWFKMAEIRDCAERNDCAILLPTNRCMESAGCIMLLTTIGQVGQKQPSIATAYGRDTGVYHSAMRSMTVGGSIENTIASSASSASNVNFVSLLNVAYDSEACGVLEVGAEFGGALVSIPT
jgi:trimethylamine:corrinoid methyltransferase-like protein